MRRFVVIGQRATASPDFRLDDVAGTSGRLDALLRCVRATTLVSHGVRRDVVTYLVLLGGPLAPRVLRVDGSSAKFLRPDERSLATLIQKTLASDADAGVCGFVDVKPGIALARAGIDAVIDELGDAVPYLLDENAPDVRDTAGLEGPHVAVFAGDHLGFDAPTRARLERLGARAVSVGPVRLHTEDALTIVSNEMDRRGPRTFRPEDG